MPMKVRQQFSLDQLNAPERMKEAIMSFVSDLAKIRILEPDASPSPNWAVFYGKDWKSAIGMAFAAASALGSGHDVLDWDRHEAELRSWNGRLFVKSASARMIMDVVEGSLSESIARRVGMHEELPLSTVEYIKGRIIEDARLKADLLADDRRYKPREEVLFGEMWETLHACDMRLADSWMQAWQKGYVPVGQIREVLYIAAVPAAHAELSESLRD